MAHANNENFSIYSNFLVCSSVSGSDTGETTWEKYLKEKKQKRKGKRSKVKETEGAAGGEGVGEGENDVGFDDPFFQHDVTTATAVSNRNSSYPRYIDMTTYCSV